MQISASLEQMRTTLNLDDDLHARLKELAARSGRTVTELLEDAIRGLLQDVGEAATTPPPTFPVFDGGSQPGIRVGIDLDDTAALLDLLDDPTPDAAA